MLGAPRGRRALSFGTPGARRVQMEVVSGPEGLTQLEPAHQTTVLQNFHFGGRFPRAIRSAFPLKFPSASASRVFTTC